MGRSPCCDKTRVKRGPWSQEEDAILRSFVQRFGNAGNWIALPQKAGNNLHYRKSETSLPRFIFSLLLLFFTTTTKNQLSLSA